MTAGYTSDIEVHPPRRISSRDILLARAVASKRCSLPPASLGRMFAGGYCAGLHGMRDRHAKRGRHRLWVSVSRFAVWSYRLSEGRIRMVCALLVGGYGAWEAQEGFARLGTLRLLGKVNIMQEK